MEQGRDLIALLALDDRGTRMCANRTRTANTPLILRQVDMALALGCKTLILLAAGPGDSDALAAQHLAEASGMRFHLLTRPQQLPALMGEASELIMLAPGSLASDVATLEEMLGAPGLLTIPADRDEAEGLERLDLHTAWGGALRMPGSLTVQIEPLGNDCELLSALPRIARSAGVIERPVPVEVMESGAWVLDPSTAPLPSTNPATRNLSDRLIAPLSRLYGQRNWPPFLPGAAALVLMLAAGVTLWFERPAIVIAVLAAAMLAISLQNALRDQAQPLRLSGGPAPSWAGLVALLPEAFAGLAVGLALAKGAGMDGASMLPAMYGAAAVLGASWLSRRSALGGIEGVTSGPVFWLGIAGFGALGLWWMAVAAGTAVAFAAIALEMRGLRRITRS